MTDSKLPFSVLCIIVYKNYPHLWNVKLAPKTKSPIFNTPVLWCTKKCAEEQQEINQQIISPLLKEAFTLLKKWDEVEFPPS